LKLFEEVESIHTNWYYY